ncbi:uncharacterized protein LTR77_005054 [Saxophila tyrrhenica]|uniref:Uncharacterized protein n=1 Tax=Saxophila tyrrhenica TaxID=1690608 RepID=A0AAV9PAX0_9PEZI|nr:hypothetical protein LTR77_005054 [Saxophila tyrrhenica]
MEPNVHVNRPDNNFVDKADDRLHMSDKLDSPWKGCFDILEQHLNTVVAGEVAKQLKEFQEARKRTLEVAERTDDAQQTSVPGNVEEGSKLHHTTEQYREIKADLRAENSAETQQFLFHLREDLQSQQGRQINASQENITKKVNKLWAEAASTLQKQPIDDPKIREIATGLMNEKKPNKVSTAINSLRRAVDQLHDLAESLTANNDSVNASINSLDTLVQDLGERLGTLETFDSSAAGDSREQHKKLRGRLDKAITRLNNISGDVGALTETVSTNNEGACSNHEQIQERVTDLATTTARLFCQREQHVALRQDHDQLARDYALLKIRCDKLEQLALQNNRDQLAIMAAMAANTKALWDRVVPCY